MSFLVRTDGPGSRLDPDAEPVSLTAVSIRLSEKSRFDSIQGAFSAGAGRRVTQWEVLSALMDDAASNPHGRFARARRHARMAQRGVPRPKAKRA